MGWILKAIHWLLHAICAVFRRILGAFWMPLPPEFFRDFQENPKPEASGSNLGLLEPPKFAPGEAKGCFIGAIMRITVPVNFVQPLLPQGVMLPAESAEPGYLHDVNLAF